MLARLISPVYNISAFGSFLLMFILLLSSVLLVWISTQVHVSLFQFIFMVVFPFTFVVIIPLFSLLFLLKVTQKEFKRDY